MFLSIRGVLNEKGVECTKGMPAFSGVEDMKNADNSGAVVLMEQINVSKYDDIEKELTSCGQYGIPIIGSIAIK